MKASQIRIVRPTERLNELIQFNKVGLGLNIIGSFQNHDGYDGVILGMPEASIHLEFTESQKGKPCLVPDRDNHLVFYFDKTNEYEKAVSRMRKAGAKEVEPENPYWMGKSTRFEYPDGRGIILFNGLFKPVIRYE
jgi:hypothetical protein